MGNKKVKLARDEASAEERLQSSIKKCIAGVTTNNTARDEKYVARWAMMFVKQDVRKENLALLTAEMSLMCAEVKAWHKV
jgi:hypothetical protein